LLQYPNNLLLRVTALPHLLSSFRLLYPGRTLLYTGTVFGGQVNPGMNYEEFLIIRMSTNVLEILMDDLSCLSFAGAQRY